MARRDTRILGALLALALGASACAQVGRPPGGPPDTQPPILRGSQPESLAVGVPTEAPLRFAFSEKVDRRGIARALELIPDVELSKPSFDDTTVSFRPLEGWPVDSVVVWTLAADLRDKHGVNMEVSRQGVFTTADALPPGRVEGSVTVRDTAAVKTEQVLARLDLPPPEGSRRPVRWRTSGADEEGRFSLRWLELPSGPFQLEVFVDANANDRRDERERVARRDSLVLALSDTVLSVGELVLLDLEGPVAMRFCVSDSTDSLLAHWRESLRPSLPDSVAADSVMASVATGRDSLATDASEDRAAMAQADADSGAATVARPQLQVWAATAENLREVESAVADSAGCASLSLTPGEWRWGLWWDADGDGRLGPDGTRTEPLLLGESFTVEPERPDSLRIGADWEQPAFAPLDTLSQPWFPPELLAEPDSL